MSVLWIGTPDHWLPLVTETPPRYAFPAEEETVLDVAGLAAFSGLKRLSQDAALNCTSRYRQRLKLDRTGLNPTWQPYVYTPRVVIKAPASCLNQGIRLLPSNPYIERLAKEDPKIAGMGIIENFIEGAAWEQDGFIIDRKLHFFYPLKQHWDEDFTRIIGYERGQPIHELERATAIALRRLGLDNAAFCGEWRESKAGWKLIEMHARPPDDKNLWALLSDEDPCAVINHVVARTHGSGRT